MKTNGIHWFPLCIPPTPRQNLPSAGFLFLFLAFSECAARPRLSMRLLHLAMMSCANPRKIPTKGVNLKEKEKKSKDQQRYILFTLLHLTLPMPKGRGFLVRQPLRRLRRIGVLHDFPKREFPCAPRYWFMLGHPPYIPIAETRGFTALR